jgi:hypothetical protein
LGEAALDLRPRPVGALDDGIDGGVKFLIACLLEQENKVLASRLRERQRG